MSWCSFLRRARAKRRSPSYTRGISFASACWSPSAQHASKALMSPEAVLSPGLIYLERHILRRKHPDQKRKVTGNKQLEAVLDAFQGQGETIRTFFEPICSILSRLPSRAILVVQVCDLWGA